jgi:hypothetical protein
MGLQKKTKAAGAKYVRESRLPCDKHTGESLLPGLFVTRQFLPMCSDTCSKYTKKLQFIAGESRLRGVFTTGELRHPGVFTTGESRLPSVFITRELFWTPGSRFTDFKEHATIFRCA